SSATTGWRIVHRHVTPQSFSFYDAVAAADSTHAWAVGGSGSAGLGNPLAGYWHHGRWATTAMPASAVGTILAVSTDGPTDAWAITVGDVLHWHRGHWTIRADRQY